VTLLLACCSKPPVEENRHEGTIPVVAPLVQRAPRQVIHTSWSFESGTDSCVAIATAGDTSLTLTIHRNEPIRLVLELAPQIDRLPAGHAAVPLRFAGPTGSWQVAGQQAARHHLAAALGTTDTALSRVLVLLGGGTLDVGTQDQVSAIGIAPSEALGQTWFDCARSKLI
jgi:hypothetical protein